MISQEKAFGDLTLDMRSVYLSMGSENWIPDAEISAQINSTLKEISLICRPRYAYKIYDSETVEKTSVTLGGRTLSTGNIITRCLRKAEQYIVFVVTAGEEFDAWMHQLKCEDDIMKIFIADSIGSEIAESIHKLMVSDIGNKFEKPDFVISNSYSPGYCDWHVSEQQTLFSLLPPNPCGVVLNDASLMKPIKSISGIIALGSEVKKMPYGCAICNKKNCYKYNIKLTTLKP